MEKSRFRSLRLVLPAYNEEQTLPIVVEDLVSHLTGWEMDWRIVLVENGSADDSARIADELAARHAQVEVFHLPEPNYGAALKKGFQSGTADLLANFSIDFVDLAFLRRAIHELETCDVVMGSKYVSPRGDRRPLWRKAGGQALGALTRWMFSLPMADTHGLMVLRREGMEGLIDCCQSGHEVFDTELMVRAHRSGRVIREMPVEVEEKRPCRIGTVRRARRILRQLVQLRILLAQEGKS